LNPYRKNRKNRNKQITFETNKKKTHKKQVFRGKNLFTLDTELLYFKVFVIFSAILWPSCKDFYMFTLFRFVFRFGFFCFGLIETPKYVVLIFNQNNRNNQNKHLVSDSIKTSFGSSFGCFESKLFLLNTLFVICFTLPMNPQTVPLTINKE
jgi:hypothetical protein